MPSNLDHAYDRAINQEVDRIKAQIDAEILRPAVKPIDPDLLEAIREKIYDEHATGLDS